MHSKFRIEATQPNHINYPPFNQQIINKIINNKAIVASNVSVVINQIGRFWVLTNPNYQDEIKYNIHYRN